MKLDFTEFIGALSELESEKCISREMILGALKHGISAAIKKKGDSENKTIEVDIDESSCEVHFYQVKVVVDEVTSDAVQMSLEEARAENPNAEIGDVVKTEVDLESFGRIDAQTTKQVVLQQIKEAEREMTRAEYSSKTHEILTASVRDVDTSGNVYVELGRTEGVIPQSETIPGEYYTRGKVIKVEMLRVETGEGKGSRNGRIIVSRKRPELVKRLFELEVPEIQNGTVIIKGVAREPGSRTKIAVQSIDPQVDPLGACVGPHFMRVGNVVKELNNEKVDIIPWDSDEATFVARALSPAKVSMVLIDSENKKARVIVDTDQQSLAIGKSGQNARLAARLTGWRIDIKTQEQLNGPDYFED